MRVAVFEFNGEFNRMKPLGFGTIVNPGPKAHVRLRGDALHSETPVIRLVRHGKPMTVKGPKYCWFSKPDHERVEAMLREARSEVVL
jgi:hypothetical protein